MAPKKRPEVKREETLRGLQRLAPNRKCADCSEKLPQNIIMDFGTFVCTMCSGIHREFSHRVKSISLAIFTDEEVEMVKKGGNDVCNALYMARYDPRHDIPEPDGSSPEKRREFIRMKYADKRWYATPEDMARAREAKERADAARAERANHASAAAALGGTERRRRSAKSTANGTDATAAAAAAHSKPLPAVPGSVAKPPGADLLDLLSSPAAPPPQQMQQQPQHAAAAAAAAAAAPVPPLSPWNAFGGSGGQAVAAAAAPAAPWDAFGGGGGGGVASPGQVQQPLYGVSAAQQGYGLPAPLPPPRSHDQPLAGHQPPPQPQQQQPFASAGAAAQQQQPQAQMFQQQQIPQQQQQQHPSPQQQMFGSPQQQQPQQFYSAAPPQGGQQQLPPVPPLGMAGNASNAGVVPFSAFGMTPPPAQQQQQPHMYYAQQQVPGYPQQPPPPPPQQQPAGPMGAGQAAWRNPNAAAGTAEDISDPFAALSVRDARAPSAARYYETGEKCVYVTNGDQAAATVIKVHHDAGDPPYYTIRLASGFEKQTDYMHLNKVAQGGAAQAHQQQQGQQQPPTKPAAPDPFSALSGSAWAKVGNVPPGSSSGAAAPTAAATDASANPFGQQQWATNGVHPPAAAAAAAAAAPAPAPAGGNPFDMF